MFWLTRLWDNDADATVAWQRRVAENKPGGGVGQGTFLKRKDKAGLWERCEPTRSASASC